MPSSSRSSRTSAARGILARPRSCRRETPSSLDRACPRDAARAGTRPGRSMTAAATSVTFAHLLLPPDRSRARTARRRGRCASRARAPRAAPPCATPRSRLPPSVATQCVGDVEVLLLVEGIEREPQAEALRQRDLLLGGLAGMDLAVDVLRLEVLVHELRHEVAAVRGGVDEHVVRASRRSSRRARP